MKNGAIIGGLVGAVVGAVIWALISALTGYEVGYVAWGIGVLVGVGARIGGGEGQVIGVVCAAMALASIFVGKIVATEYGLRTELHKMIMAEITRETYDELMDDADAFAKLESEDEYPEFIARHGYAESDDLFDVTEEDIEDFKEFTVPELRERHDNPPSFEEWRRTEESEVEETVDMLMANVSTTEAVVEDLNWIDAIFAVLGLITAYKIGAGTAEVSDT